MSLTHRDWHLTVDLLMRHVLSVLIESHKHNVGLMITERLLIKMPRCLGHRNWLRLHWIVKIILLRFTLLVYHVLMGALMIILEAFFYFFA